jgi:peptidoglycan/xylan/chitin deacetylase (PgdA/CDA1 family)
VRIRVTALSGIAAVGLFGLTAPRWIVRSVVADDPAVLFSVPVKEPIVALTIDDGPTTETDAILDVLSEHEAKATFFFIGEHLQQRPAVARRVIEDGHEAGHHMLRDEPSIRLSPEAFAEQFELTHRLLEELGGSRLFRPGSGWYNESMKREVERRGYRMVLGWVYPFDALLASSAFSTWFIRSNLRPGAIIILHDGGGRGRRTAAVLREILPELREQGYRVVTVSELLRASADVNS